MAKRAPKTLKPTPSRKTLATREWLREWLRTQPKEVSVAIAARAALRALPLWGQFNPEDSRRFAVLTLAVFRASALARVAAKYPTRANEMGSAADAAAAAGRVAASTNSNVFNSYAAYAAADAAAAAAAAAADTDAFNVASAAAYAADSAADAADADADADVNPINAAADGATTADAFSIANRVNYQAALLALPLWQDNSPPRITSAWLRLRARLPLEDGWQIWIDWYEGLLRGGIREEAYELAFVEAPEDVWKQGAKAVNAWIAARLPKWPTPEHDALPAPTQRPALFAFKINEGRIDIAAQAFHLENRRAAQAFLDESRRLSGEMRARLEHSNNPVRGLGAALGRLDARLSHDLDALNIPLLVASLDALEGLRSAVESAEGRAEYALEDIAQVVELHALLRRLVGQSPEGQEILVIEAAQEIATPAAAETVDTAVAAVAGAAANSPLVAPRVPQALREPEADILEAPNLSARIRISALRFLTTQNFVSALDTLGKATAAGTVGVLAADALPHLGALIDAVGGALEHVADVVGRDGKGAGALLAGIAAVVAAWRKHSSVAQAAPTLKPKPKARSAKPSSKKEKKT